MTRLALPSERSSERSSTSLTSTLMPSSEWQAEEFVCLGRQAPADDEVDAAAGLYFVKQHFALEREVGNLLAGFFDAAFVGVDVDDIAHVHLADIHFDGQRAGVFLRVEEDGGQSCRPG